MLILPADAEDSVVGGVEDRVRQSLGDNGEVGKVDRWGRRRLAYELDRRTEGLYLLVQFRAEPTAIRGLERALTLADDVVRFKVVVRAA
jgi:small subunit ribosomal protein S6